jgi:hypothetical protein
VQSNAAFDQWMGTVTWRGDMPYLPPQNWPLGLPDRYNLSTNSSLGILEFTHEARERYLGSAADFGRRTVRGDGAAEPDRPVNVSRAFPSWKRFYVD